MMPGPTGSLRIEDFAPRHMAGLEQVLGAEGLLDPETPFGKFWRATLDRPLARATDFVVGVDEDGEPLGAALLFRRLVGRPAGRTSLIWVPTAQRRQGIGSRLKREMDARLHNHGLSMHYALLYHQSEEAQGFLAANGFTLYGNDLIITWNGGIYPKEPVEGLRCDIYRGGDRAMNQKIAEFQNRAFVREPMVPILTAEIVESILTEEGSWMMIATEEATGAIAGICECTDTPIFPSISIGRRYWASGLAEWIGGQCLDIYVAAGIERPWTIARKSNHASINFLARMNWHPDAESWAYCAAVPSAADYPLDR